MKLKRYVLYIYTYHFTCHYVQLLMSCLRSVSFLFYFLFAKENNRLIAF